MSALAMAAGVAAAYFLVTRAPRFAVLVLAVGVLLLVAGCSIRVRSVPEDMHCVAGHDEPNGDFHCDEYRQVAP